MKHPFRVISKSVMTLLIALTILLTDSACMSAVKAEDTEVLEIPSIDSVATVEKPTLIAIPSLNGISFSLEQTNALSAVFEAYNINLANVILYSEELEQMYELKIRYLENIINILNNNK